MAPHLVSERLQPEGIPPVTLAPLLEMVPTEKAPRSIKSADVESWINDYVHQPRSTPVYKWSSSHLNTKQRSEELSAQIKTYLAEYQAREDLRALREKIENAFFDPEFHFDELTPESQANFLNILIARLGDQNSKAAGYFDALGFEIFVLNRYTGFGFWSVTRAHFAKSSKYPFNREVAIPPFRHLEENLMHAGTPIVFLSKRTTLLGVPAYLTIVSDDGPGMTQGIGKSFDNGFTTVPGRADQNSRNQGGVGLGAFITELFSGAFGQTFLTLESRGERQLFGFKNKAQDAQWPRPMLVGTRYMLIQFPEHEKVLSDPQIELRDLFDERVRLSLATPKKVRALRKKQERSAQQLAEIRTEKFMELLALDENIKEELASVNIRPFATEHRPALIERILLAKNARLYRQMERFAQLLGQQTECCCIRTR